MRIAMVHSSFAIRGGAEQYVRDLSGALAARGHEIGVFSRPSQHAAPQDQEVHRRITDRLSARSGPLRKIVTHLGDVADPTGLRVRDLASFAPDVVHVHNWQGLGIRPVARLAEAYPTVHSVHDFAVADPDNALGNIGQATLVDALLAMRSAALVHRLRAVTLLFPSERTRATLLRLVPAAGALDQRVVLLSSPVPPQRRALPPGDKATFLYMGALAGHKGLGDLLRCWTTSSLPTRGTLLIAGDGPMRGAVEAAAAADPSVRYLGYLDETGKQRALLTAGWFLFPSRWPETYGLVCAEALVAGRPILASRIAEPVMATPGSYLLFDGPDELGPRLEEAAALPDAQYATMTAAARADGELLDWDRHVDAVAEAYRSVRARRTAAADPMGIAE